MGLCATNLSAVVTDAELWASAARPFYLGEFSLLC